MGSHRVGHDWSDLAAAAAAGGLPGFPGGCVVKNRPANAGYAGDAGSISASGRLPGEGNATPLLLPGKFHAQRSLVGHSPWDCTESDMTEPQSAPRLVNSRIYFSWLWRLTVWAQRCPRGQVLMRTFFQIIDRGLVRRPWQQTRVLLSLKEQ